MQARRSTPTAKLVVVIDDDRFTLEAMDGLLRNWGYRVVTASSDSEALDRLAGRRPDIIISDLRLAEGKTGLQAIERLRQAFEIPAMIITGSDTSPDSQPGDFQWLSKPLHPTSLKEALDRIFSSEGLTQNPNRPK